MNRLYRTHCCLFDRLLTFQSDDLVAQYGDEMRAVFRDELQEAWQEGITAILRVWSEVLAETIVLTAPRYAARLLLLLAASVLASGLAAGTLSAFAHLNLHLLSRRAPRRNCIVKAKQRVTWFGFLTGIRCFSNVQGIRMQSPP